MKMMKMIKDDVKKKPHEKYENDETDRNDANENNSGEWWTVCAWKHTNMKLIKIIYIYENEANT